MTTKGRENMKGEEGGKHTTNKTFFACSSDLVNQPLHMLFSVNFCMLYITALSKPDKQFIS
jgi:hypothetical protein